MRWKFVSTYTTGCTQSPTFSEIDMALCVIILEDLDPAKNDGKCLDLRMLSEGEKEGERSLALVTAKGIHALICEAQDKAKDADAA